MTLNWNAAYSAVLQTNGYRRVAMDGLAFKEGTDDLRESPMVGIAEYLIGKGYDLLIYDPAVKAARLTGANRSISNIASHTWQIDWLAPRMSCSHMRKC